MSRDERGPDRQLFDRYVEQYPALVSRVAGLSGEGVDYFARYKLERILDLCDAAAPPRHILDIGCGVGLLTELLGSALPATRVTGLDPSPKSLDDAASRCDGLRNVVFSLYDGKTLPAEAGGAELVILANVLHHVERAARPALLGEVILGALPPGGRVVVFEHNPYNPLTRLAVRSCAFDRDAHLLTRRSATALLRRTPLRILQGNYIVFFPRILRRLRRLERRMGWLPLGAQYMVVAERIKPQGGAGAGAP
jgi:SAM-dependent methyltransferase